MKYKRARSITFLPFTRKRKMVSFKLAGLLALSYCYRLPMIHRIKVTCW
jgi:hypothetical protein